MNPVTTITSPAVPLLRDNIDTDTIIPSREMKSTGRAGLADGLFAPWRYTDAASRTRDPSFVLNQRDAIGTRLILAGKNFGCGSSREHAVWALAEFGIEAIIAPSFAPIFKANCIRNGLLPIELPEEVVRSLAWEMVRIDLAAQTVSAGEESWPFEIDPEAKEMLLGGLDAIDVTLNHLKDTFDRWMRVDMTRRPWVYLSPRRTDDGAQR
ncbi:3-isopropylmalate dehydratase small subunit 1 [Tsuneonella dongtanensis]|uniref:3-isopropylmalate dehydratase n=1 Tax=Tsuneonella dongtanensis TaxID=692370 RepID=A0A1B2AG53_9SPHN|nr:3-isopropylmalate dehydratase small subunit [Tsuneonella dongtanensis]ANY21122.1 3-isopropylmalate dehydratase small subunit 1 [Tsuneonella dongtanensis]